jgi:Ca-activated chloride channel homolog
MTLLAALRLLRPEALALLLLVPLFAWIALRGRRKRAGEIAAVAARGLLLAVVALALALPRWETTTSFRAVAYVLDVSDSIPPAPLADAKEFVRRSASARGPDDDASFVVFAAGAAVEAPMARLSATLRGEPVPIDPKNVATRIPTGESDVQGALRLARAGFPPGGARGVVLLTDGNETRGDGLLAVKELLSEGTEVTVVPIRYERPREVWVEKVVVPSVSPENAPVGVRVVVQSTDEGVPARLRCLVDGAEVLSDAVTLRKDRSVFELKLPFATPGFHRIEAVVEPESDGDPVNNRGAAATFVRGRGRVLVASNEEGSPLGRALSEGLDLVVDVAGPSALPSDPGGWVPYDCVVLENVPVWILSEQQRRNLRAAVEDLGVGIVCVGGPMTYGPGGYGGTDLEAVLPVTSDVQNRRVLPSGALVVALHSCEFPDGNSIGREVSKLAIKALASDDEMGLIEFAMDGNDRWVIPLTEVGDKYRHLALVDKSQPSDAPSLRSILQKAADALEKSGAAAKHVIVISDGDPEPPTDKLLTRLASPDVRITVTTVCVDPHTFDGPRSMKKIADATGGNHYALASKDRDRLPQIFIKEAVTVRRSAWSEAAFTPALRGVHRMTREFGVESFPQLHGHVVTSLRPEAEPVLAGPEEDPVLATWRHGLGQATAWTSDASPRWAPEWVSWSGYQKFWTQVVRSSLRAVERPTARAQVEIDGGSAHVVLDALRDDGTFDNGLRVAGKAVAPGGGGEAFKLAQTGPGRYEGTFPAQDVGTYLATLTWTDPQDPSGERVAQAQAAVCVAYSAEHLAQRSNERLFAAMEAAGARLLDVEAADRAAGTDPAKDPARLPWAGAPVATDDVLDLWPWLAGIAAVVLVADVAVRRVRIDWSKFRRKPAAAAPRGKVATGAARAPVAGAFDPAATSPVEIAGSTAPRPETPAPAAPRPAAPEGGGLLDAKRRAQKKQTWEENQP